MYADILNLFLATILSMHALGHHWVDLPGWLWKIGLAMAKNSGSGCSARTRAIQMMILTGTGFGYSQFRITSYSHTTTGRDYGPLWGQAPYTPWHIQTLRIARLRMSLPG